MKKRKELNKKQIRQIHTGVRAAIQILYFLFLPGAFTAAFNGIKYIFTQIGGGETIAVTAFVKVLVALCVFTIVFGRFFCGFACAFGSLGDGVHALYVFVCRRLKKKPLKLDRRICRVCTYLKYAVLAAIVMMCFFGVYGRLRGSSPWDVFSMLHALNFHLQGYLAGGIFIVLILVGMALEERFFCKFFCPMGAIFSLLPVLPFSVLRRDRADCIPNCKACTMKCPSDIALPESGAPELRGDCFQCQKCIDTCPKSNIHSGIPMIKGNEIWYTLVRAAILLVLLIWLGI